MTHREGQLLFNAFTQLCPGHHYDGSWRTPWARDRSINLLSTWREIGENLERGRFDSVFIADGLGMLEEFHGTHAEQARLGMEYPNNDAIVVATAVAAMTQELGIMFTSSVIQYQPFELARLVTTLDLLVGGRVGWNVVTSSLANSYRNMGYPDIPSREERYAPVDEYMQVVYKLWEGSWDEGAVLNDWESGDYTDPSKIYRINHHGERYDVEGPFLSEPSLQRTPVIATPGGGEYAMRMAARHSELMLTGAPSPEAIHTMRLGLDGFLEEYGRDKDELRLMASLHFVVGETHEDAERRYEEIHRWINPQGSLIVAGGIRKIDLGKYPLDEVFDIRDEPEFARVYAERLELLGNPTQVTVRELTGFGERRNTIVGSPAEIADVLEEYRDAGLGGVNVGDALYHQSYGDFVDLLVPELQARGLMQKEYAPGTLRNKIFGNGDRLPPSHPATTWRGRFDDAITNPAPIPVGGRTVWA